MDKLQALHKFWAGFGWRAYDENSVPDNAVLPYITHENAVSAFNEPVAQTASLWDRTTSWGDLVAKAEQISEAITRGGIILHFDGGALIIRKASPWAQRMSGESDDTVKRIILNYEVEYFV